jgi:polar amino acid transport system substrate-binding protein
VTIRQARRWLLPLALTACSANAVDGLPLRMAIDSATRMPMARIEGGQIRGGMNHELGALLAARMGRGIGYLAVPRKRLLGVLERNEADLVCTYKPEWLSGKGLQWSKPFFRQTEVLVTRAEAPAPRRLPELQGQRIGTVLGFVYPELTREVGANLLRDDAPDAEANLRKLAAGRLQHAVVEQRLLRHLQASGVFTAAVHSPLLIGSQLTHCALAPQAPVTLGQLDQAIGEIERDGSLAALYARYP